MYYGKFKKQEKKGDATTTFNIEHPDPVGMASLPSP
jgi:hypothetical protein